MEDRTMNSFREMLWIELRKAVRSRLPLWTAFGYLFMPVGMTFLIFIARNPEITRQLGLLSAKANLVAYSATDWSAYLSLFAQIIAAGGFIFSVFAVSWVFGREFADGTLKDMLAVPVQRASILLAKFAVVAIWSVALILLVFVVSLIMGALLQLPGDMLSIIVQSVMPIAITACLMIVVVLPFALFASIGRGYLLPVGVAILALIMANLVVVTGWGEYFPWAIPMLYAQGKSALTPISFWIVLLTGLAGMIGTYLWWKYADQNR
jgi:ABC-2 type transport system permease protein